MITIEFKDGVVVELHDDLSFDIVKLSRTDVMLNYYASVTGKEDKLFKIINSRLGGVLSP